MTGALTVADHRERRPIEGVGRVRGHPSARAAICRSAVAVGVPGGAENKPVIRRWVALKSSGTGQWLAITNRPAGADEGADQSVERDVAAGRQPRLLSGGGACLAGGVAGPRMTRSASSFRSKISRKVSRPSDPSPPKLVSNAGCAAHLAARVVTTPWVAKCRIR